MFRWPRHCILGECVQKSGRLEQAAKLFRRCLAITEVKLGQGDARVDLTLRRLGECVQKAGRQEGAEELPRRRSASMEVEVSG